MHRAAYQGSYEAVNFCLEYTNLKIYSGDFQGDTPLHFAAQNFNISCLRLMLNHKRFEEKSHVHLKVKNKKGETVMGLIQKSIEEIVGIREFAGKVQLTENDILGYLYHNVVPEFLLKEISKLNVKLKTE